MNGLSSYSDVEVGFPTIEPPPSWFEYAEGAWDDTQTINYTDTIYPYIPIELVQEYIDLHGGIDVEKTFKKGDQ
jgi:hypothetical protein